MLGLCTAKQWPGRGHSLWSVGFTFSNIIKAWNTQHLCARSKWCPPPFCFCFLSLQPLHEADSGGASILPWQQCDSPWCKGELSCSQASETTEHVPWLAKDNLLNIFITPEVYTAQCYCLPVKTLSSLLVGRQMLKATHALPESFPWYLLLILSLVTLWFLE